MLTCERCKKPIKSEAIDRSVPWEQYLCSECYKQIWNDLMEEHCPECRTRPCERGGECWINPWPNIMYLCYVAPKAEDVHPDQTKLTTQSYAER